MAATATMAALVVFMLVFGPGLLSDLAHLLDVEAQRSVGANCGASVCLHRRLPRRPVVHLHRQRHADHYLFGAPESFRFFFRWESSAVSRALIPYAGPVTIAVVVTVLTLLTSGAVKAAIVRRVLPSVWAVRGERAWPCTSSAGRCISTPLLLCSPSFSWRELMGVVGAVLAVPVVAVAQVVFRDLMMDRRTRLKGQQSE